MERFDVQALAYCLMDNHYHFVMHTREANLSRLMRHINGVYTQAYNRRHGKVGHLFQGRFKAILVDRDAYLLEVCRYVDLNPVRARMVTNPEQWLWSSYRAHLGQTVAPPWLDTEGLHEYLLGKAPESASARRQAARRYARFVAQGVGEALWEKALNRQIYLGDDNFVKRMQSRAEPEALSASPIPKQQRSKLKKRTLKQWLAHSDTREQALRNAYVHSGLTMTAMAQALGLSTARVSQLIAAAEAEGGR